MAYNMKDETYVYMADLPPGTNEMVAPCCDGCYTVYLDWKLSDAGRLEAYKHAINHIRGCDHEKQDVQEVEAKAHEGD